MNKNLTASFQTNIHLFLMTNGSHLSISHLFSSIFFPSMVVNLSPSRVRRVRLSPLPSRTGFSVRPSPCSSEVAGDCARRRLLGHALACGSRSKQIEGETASSTRRPDLAASAVNRPASSLRPRCSSIRLHCGSIGRRCCSI